MNDFFKYVEPAVTVCDTECVIVYQNEKSVAVNGDMRGKCMLGCHNDQTPWYKDAADGSGRTVAGIVELSVVIPEEMPHYDRG